MLRFNFAKLAKIIEPHKYNPIFITSFFRKKYLVFMMLFGHRQ